jgi:glutathione S-transferase
MPPSPQARVTANALQLEKYMTDSRKLVLYYSPQTRAVAARILLEELGAPYEVKVVNVRAGETRRPEYLAINPMGKVPTITHGDTVVTEQIAIFTYLADLFPEKKLAPGLTDPHRGSYLRWLAFYAGCFEPALMDKFMKRELAPASTSPYGDYDIVIQTITDQLAKGPYILGDTFCAADIVWGSGLAWTTAFKLVPEHPVIMDYVKRFNARPMTVKVREMDAERTKANVPA